MRAPVVLDAAKFKMTRYLIVPGVAAEPLSETTMPHAIIRREYGRRHEVDFGNAPIRVEIFASDETAEIFIEADSEMLPQERRRFTLLNIPRHLFSEATAAGARPAANPVLHSRRDE
jgi:hypothetical protein